MDDGFPGAPMTLNQHDYGLCLNVGPIGLYAGQRDTVVLEDLKPVIALLGSRGCSVIQLYSAKRPHRSLAVVCQYPRSCSVRLRRSTNPACTEIEVEPLRPGRPQVSAQPPCLEAGSVGPAAAQYQWQARYRCSLPGQGTNVPWMTYSRSGTRQMAGTEGGKDTKWSSRKAI